MAIFRSSAAGGKWATTTSWEEETSPGVWTPAIAAPGIADTVNLVKAGGTIEVATATTAEAKSIEANAAGNEYEKTLKLTSTANLKVAGSIIFSTAMTWSVSSGTVEVTNTSGTATVNFQGKEGQKFTQNGAGGTVKLTGAMPLAGALTITAGTFDSNGQEVNATKLEAAASTTVKLGASTVICTTTGNAWSVTETTTVEAGTSTIEFTNSSETGKSFKGGGKTYITLILASDNCEVAGSNTFTNLRINTRGKSVKGTSFEKTSTQTITGEFTANSTNTEKIKIESSVSGKTWTIKKTSGLVEVTGVELKDGTAEGGAGFVDRGPGSKLNISGNTGWQFPDEVWPILQYPPNMMSPSGLNLARMTPFPPFFPVVVTSTKQYGEGEAILRGGGALVDVGLKLVSSEVIVKGGGRVTDTGLKLSSSTVIITAGGKIIDVVHMTGVAAASLAGGGKITDTGLKLAQSGVAVSGGGRIVDTGQRVVTSPVVVVTAGGKIVDTGLRLVYSSASIGGGGRVTDTGLKLVSSSTALAGGGKLTDTGLKLAQAAATIRAGGKITDTGLRIVVSTPTLAGGGKITSTSQVLAEGIAALRGGGRLVDIGVKVSSGAIIIEGGGRVVDTGARLVSSTASIRSGGRLVDTGARVVPSTAIAISAGGSIAARVRAAAGGVATLSGGGRLVDVVSGALAKGTAVISGGGRIVVFGEHPARIILDVDRVIESLLLPQPVIEHILIPVVDVETPLLRQPVIEQVPIFIVLESEPPVVVPT